jgi:hypothetical protein
MMRNAFKNPCQKLNSKTWHESECTLSKASKTEYNCNELQVNTIADFIYHKDSTEQIIQYSTVL